MLKTEVGWMKKTEEMKLCALPGVMVEVTNVENVVRALDFYLMH